MQAVKQSICILSMVNKYIFEKQKQNMLFELFHLIESSYSWDTHTHTHTHTSMYWMKELKYTLIFKMPAIKYLLAQSNSFSNELWFQFYGSKGF